MSEESWSLERIHKEIYDARTKVFVVAKVLETGILTLSDHPEWVLVIKPVLKDLLENVSKVEAFLEEPKPTSES
jgi:hypothetical protein